jgi:phosphatidate cytidylyltransferase
LGVHHIGICTVIVSWYLAAALAEQPWMVCSVNEFRWSPEPLECSPHHIFQKAESIIPAQLFELFPSHFVKMVPGIVEYCSIEGVQEVTRCISGESAHSFHHFELILRNVYPIQIHALWLGLFASCVAPFGGFLASAIKRAYGIKDFDSVIPGHGGLTDRFDCQFLMALCTWVHYNTFVRMATVSAPKLVYMYNMLSDEEKRAFIDSIAKTSDRQIRKRLDDFFLAG